MKNVWTSNNPDPALAQTLSRELSISPLCARVLINRGVKELEQAEIFLNPRLKHLRDPQEIPDIRRAAERVVLARERGEKVLVFGDFDVDGVSGTALLVETLKFLGMDAEYYIPHRYGEGYSLSAEAVKKIAESGVRLIITVDCGVSSLDEVELAKSLGIDVIVTDHHTLPAKLPRAFAIINPKLIRAEHPCKELSGAGVAFKFAWALLRAFDKKDNLFLTSLLDLAALGTFSDVVPLTDENRIIAVSGLNLINQRRRLGLKCLADAASLKEKISTRDINFGLAPRINAAGRLEHASKSVELLLTRDNTQARSLAEELNVINVRRKDIGEEVREEAFSQINEAELADTKIIVVSGQGWHPGVIGIIASRMVDRYFRPAILIGINDGNGRGSARSIEGVNIFDLLNRCSDLFLDFGGHAGAAGFDIQPERIPLFKERLKKASEEAISFDDLCPRILIDAELSAAQISMTLIKELESLSPFGEGNPSPVFMIRGLSLYDMWAVGKNGKHLKAKFADEPTILDTIGFDMGGLESKLSYTEKYDIAFQLGTNEWDGFEVAQLSLIDIRENNDK